MRKALFVGVLLAALAYAAPAAAGCWSTVQLAPPPTGTKAGTAWTAEITVLQHGRNPLPDASDARPRVTITNAAGDSETFTAKPLDPSKGTYSAKVVFPSGGTWNYAVFDDFTSAGGEPAPCSQTHDVGTATIGKGASRISTSGGLPIWPLAGAALLLVAAGVYFRRRRGLRAGRTPVV